ncbi:MAG: transglutaminase N-terminal domain-containing protein [Devosiaceae bacterium]
MRLSVHHTETFNYDAPSMGTIQVMRITPRDYTGHYVCDWSVDVDADCKLETSKDAFGNIITSFSVMGPIEMLQITAEGEIETEETHGIIRGAAEPVPNGIYLRPSHSEQQTALVRMLMNAAGEAEGPPLNHMHSVMAALHSALPITPNPDAGENDQAQQQAQQKAGAQAQSQAQEQQETGVAKPEPTNPALTRLKAFLAERSDFDQGQAALLFCDAARRYGLPARLVSGYRLPESGQVTKTGRDIWAEVLIDELGWTGFDPIQKNCPSEESARVAIGLDLANVLPTRVAHYGGALDFTQDTRIAVRQIRS